MTDEAVELISPRPALSVVNLRAWAGLAGVLAVRNFRVRYLRVKLGLLWPLVQPTLQALVLSLVFTKIFGVRGVKHYPLYVLSGVMTWQAFSGAVSQAAQASLESAQLIKKVPVPATVFAVAAVGGQLLIFSAQLVVLIVGAALSHTLTVRILWLLPLGVLVQTCLALGIGLLVGAFLPALRDLKFAVDAALLVAFYATPIMYDPSRLPESIRNKTILNPMTGVMQLHRGALLDRAVDWWSVLYAVGWAIPLLALGLVVYRRRSATFADSV
jgi:ABC-type polysaccharide/polyol phosphate export permease